MSWSSIAENQTVSFSNLLDAAVTGQLVAKIAFTSSQECITKNEADTYVYIDTAYPPYESKDFNQLVVKGDLVTYSKRIYGIDAYVTTSFGWARDGLILYSDNGGLTWVSKSLVSYSVSKNDTGQYVLSTYNSGEVQVSNDFGESFTIAPLSGSPYPTYGGTMSDSGNYMYAITQTNVATVGDNSPSPTIYKSSNYGVSWSKAYTYPRSQYQYDESSAPHSMIATSATGQYILGTWAWDKPFQVKWGCSFMRSTNYGVSWTATDFADSYLTDVAISSTGQYQIMSRMSAFGSGNIFGQGGLYWSNNYGAGFANKIYEENYRALYCAMSSNGQRMLVAYMNTNNTGNRFYFSTNFGVNWGYFDTNPVPPYSGGMPGGVFVSPSGNYALITYVDRPQITYTINFENWYTIPISESYNFSGLED